MDEPSIGQTLRGHQEAIGGVPAEDQRRTIPTAKKVRNQLEPFPTKSNATPKESPVNKAVYWALRGWRVGDRQIEHHGAHSCFCKGFTIVSQTLART